MRDVHPGLIGRAAAILLLASMPTGCSSLDTSTRDTPSARYDPVSGRLTELAFDATRNGRNDSIGFMEGTRVQRIEVDENEDGKVDRWEFYDENRGIERIEYSRQHNGVVDAIAFFGADGNIVRLELAARGDAAFNRVEFYERGSLVRVEEDTNGDTRVDKWETYAADTGRAPGQPGLLLTASFDDSFRGAPTRRLVYRPDGTVLRVEMDPDGDGIFHVSTAARTHNGN